MITGLGWILLLIAGVFIIWNSRRHKMADREIRKAILTQSTVRCTLMHLHAAPLLRLVNEVLQREGQLSRNCHAHETGLKELAKQFDVTLASNETLMVENSKLTTKNDSLYDECQRLIKENSQLLAAGVRVYEWQRWAEAHPAPLAQAEVDAIGSAVGAPMGASA